MARAGGRRILRGMLACAGAAVLLVTLLAGVVLLPAAEGARRWAVEWGLTRLWGESVTIGGAVHLELWPRPVLSVAGVDSHGSDGAAARVEQVVVGLPDYDDLLAGRLFYRLSVDGAQLAVPLDGGADAQSGSLLESPIHLLSLLPHLDIQRTDIRLFDAHGWAFEVKVARLSSQQAGSRTALAAEASLNGTPVQLGFAFDLEARPEEGPRSYGAEIRFAVPGPEGGLSTRLDVRAPTPSFDHGLDMRLDAEAGSLSQVLVLAGLAPSFEGKGTVRARLHAEPDRLAVADFQLDLWLTDGAQVQVAGAVGDLPTLQGVDVKAVATLSANAASAVSLRDIMVTRLSGAFRSGPDGLMLENTLIETNAFDQSFREIGPIFVHAVERDSAGRVAFKGISIQAGPLARPVSRLTGDVRDVLRFEGVNLVGSVDLPVASLLALPPTDGARLGRLVGRLAVSEAGSGLSVDAFSARIEGSDLLQASVDLSLHDLAGSDAAAGGRMDTRLDIPNYAAFAAVFGVQVAFQGPLRFEGSVSGTADVLALEGRTDIGRTQILGAFTSRAKPDGRLLVGGTVTSPQLFVDELASLTRAETQGGRRPVALAGAKPPEGGSQIDLMATTDADITLSADRLEGSGAGAKGLQARVVLNGGALRVDPLRITYLGGAVSAVLATESAHVLRLKGAGDGLPLAALMGPDAAIKVSGTLRLAFDLTARTDGDDPLATLGGSLTARVGRGRIGTGLLDLAGMGVVGGLFTSSLYRGDSELRCARVPLVFEKGVARTNPMLVVITENIQALGRGTIDLPRNRIDLLVVPRPLNALFGEAGHSFTVKGALASPSIALASGGADLKGRVGCDN